MLMPNYLTDFKPILYNEINRIYYRLI